MMLQRGLPAGSRVRECPGCDESAYMWLVQLAPNRVRCERCRAIFDPQTGADSQVRAVDRDGAAKQLGELQFGLPPQGLLADAG